MLILQLFVILFLSLAAGSFLNVLIWRLDDEKAPKFWQGRSICPKCKKQLIWFDNIPLLSFFLLLGKCRHCGKNISFQYPLVELTTVVASITTFFVLNLSFNVDLFLILIILYSFIVIFFADWIYGLIPDEMEISAVVATTVLFINHNLSFLIWQNLFVGLISALAFFLVVVATKFRGMGLGDVKLAFVMGFILGWRQAMVAFWISFILGGIFAVALLLLRRKNFRETIALGPFLVLGTLIAALWSNKLLALVGF